MEAARRHGRVVPLARAGGDGPPDGRVFDGPGALEGRPNQQELPRLRGERVLDVVRRARFTRVDDAAVTRANEVRGAAEPELHRHVGVARVVLGEEEPVDEALAEIVELPIEDLLEQRYQRLMKFGVFRM